MLPIYGARNLPIATERAHAEAAGESRRPLLEDVAVINELMRHNSANTCLAFLTLPPLPPQATSNNAVAKVRAMVVVVVVVVVWATKHSP